MTTVPLSTVSARRQLQQTFLTAPRTRLAGSDFGFHKAPRESAS